MIKSPLKGKNWVVANGASNTSPHRQTLIALDGKARISQRFAIDFAKLGDDGRLAKDSLKDNRNYYGYGEEVVAVSDAKVVSVQDNIPENIPLESPAVPITLQSIVGNYVILDIGKGFYAFYAHLQPKSIKVKVGDKIRAGQTLGLVGNSANSDLPHLHFHIANANSPLAAEGIPFLFDRFDALGFVDSADALAEGKEWEFPRNHKMVVSTGQSPLSNMVVNFDLSEASKR